MSVLYILNAQAYRSYFGETFTNWYSQEAIDNHIFADHLFCSSYVELIDEKEYQEVGYWMYSSNGDIGEHYYLREELETGTLYFYDKYAWTGYPAVEYVVATMDLELGDKFYFPTDTRFDNGFVGLEQDETGYYTEVDSVFYDENDTENRKHIRMKLKHPVTNHAMEFIEGIGSTFGFFYQKSGMPMYGELTCYENENGIWKNTQHWDEHYTGPDETRFDCIYTTLVDIPSVSTVSLNIQQSKQTLIIRFHTQIIAQVILYDLQGRIQSKVDVMNNDVIQIRNIPSGSYVFQLTDENKKTIMVKKVIL